MIETKFENSVYSISLNRPEKHNAFDAGMIAAFSSAVHDLPPEARLVVITGKGKSFCAGADVGYMREQASFSEEQNRDDAKKLAHMFESIYQLTIPTLVYAQGNVFGGGLGLIAAADIAIAEVNAKFCFSEVKLGIIPAVISPFVLRKTGTPFAKRYFLSGEIFSAAKAEAAGLISQVVPEVEAQDAMARITEALLAAAPGAQKSAKRLLHAFENFEPMSRDQLIHELAKLRASEDAQVRMAKFLSR